MRIKINEKWGIKSDIHSFVLCRISNSNKEDKDEIWKGKKYCDNLSHVLEEYIKSRLLRCDAESFEELTEVHYRLMNELKELKERIEETFEQNIELIESEVEKE